jgi:hypothetical protein
MLKGQSASDGRQFVTREVPEKSLHFLTERLRCDRNAVTAKMNAVTRGSALELQFRGLAPQQDDRSVSPTERLFLKFLLYPRPAALREVPRIVNIAPSRDRYPRHSVQHAHDVAAGFKIADKLERDLTSGQSDLQGCGSGSKLHS